MRHQKHHASLGVTREHRESMLSNLAAALITHGRIQTTLTKARVLRPFIEKLITKAKHAAGKLCRNSASSVGGVSTITGGVPAGKPAKKRAIMMWSPRP